MGAGRIESATESTIVGATSGHVDGIARAHVRSWQAAYAGILEKGFLDGLSIEDRARRWHEILRNSESDTLVALQSDAVVGFVSYGQWRDDETPEDRGEIRALYAAPEVWGQGVGRALLHRALDDLTKSGRSDVSLWVFSANDRGIRFYRSFGFVRVDGSEKSFEVGGRSVEEVCLRRRARS